MINIVIIATILMLNLVIITINSLKQLLQILERAYEVGGLIIMKCGENE